MSSLKISLISFFTLFTLVGGAFINSSGALAGAKDLGDPTEMSIDYMDATDDSMDESMVSLSEEERMLLGEKSEVELEAERLLSQDKSRYDDMLADLEEQSILDINDEIHQRIIEDDLLEQQLSE